MSAQIPEDSIFLCGAPIEDHREGINGASETHWEYIPKSGIYGVPYGTIVPKGSQTVWVVGRCFSATHDAHASCRSMAQTMSMGTAAGLAAALSLTHEFDANNLDVSLLRDELYKRESILEVPEKTAMTGKEDWNLNVNSHAFH